MIIKKYKASTEKEAILMAQEDLGPEAIVMNVKTIKPRGMLKAFRKNRVELTAAIDDSVAEKTHEVTKSSAESASNGSDNGNYLFGRGFVNDTEVSKEVAQNAIEEKINNIAKLLEQQMSAEKNRSTRQEIVEEPEPVRVEEPVKPVEDSHNKVIDLIYNQLLDNEVSEKNAKAILSELPDQSDRQPIDNILANVYQKIVLKLGQVETLSVSENKPKIVFFVGNTGVGKTTTMAKIASKCRLEDKLNIAMFSLDTYRIAAIDQIKTYANIISVPMEVVYTPEEMKKYVEMHNDCDLIFVDTAGRSHQNDAQREDLQMIVDSVQDYEKEVYLVVSATVKYSDLLKIAKAYEDMFDYRIIFTKLDETKGVGNILNLKMDMGKQLSYVTSGQNVPDDISEINPQVIAKKLLGGGE